MCSPEELISRDYTKIAIISPWDQFRKLSEKEEEVAQFIERNQREVNNRNNSLKKQKESAIEINNQLLFLATQFGIAYSHWFWKKMKSRIGRIIICEVLQKEYDNFEKGYKNEVYGFS